MNIREIHARRDEIKDALRQVYHRESQLLQSLSELQAKCEHAAFERKASGLRHCPDCDYWATASFTPYDGRYAQAL